MAGGAANAVYNRRDSVLVILENFYTSATGQEHNPSTGTNPRGEAVRMSSLGSLRGVGVRRARQVNPSRVGETVKAPREAKSTTARGRKVVVARGECQVEGQRRERPMDPKRAAATSPAAGPSNGSGASGTGTPPIHIEGGVT